MGTHAVDKPEKAATSFSSCKAATTDCLLARACYHYLCWSEAKQYTRLYAADVICTSLARHGCC